MTVSEQVRRFKKEASLMAFESNIAFDELLHIVGCEIIIETVKRYRGNQSAAAHQLRIHRNTLGRWLISAKELGMEIPRLKGKEHLRRGKKQRPEWNPMAVSGQDKVQSEPRESRG